MNNPSSSKLIEDYALIGDCRGAALVARNGDIDWFVAPRFDSRASFSSLLGTAADGVWSLHPVGEVLKYERHYIQDTLVLETEMTTSLGKIKITDAMIIRDGWSRQMVRRVECLQGSVEVESIFHPHFDFGSRLPWTRYENGAINAISGPDSLYLQTTHEWHKQDVGWRTTFTLKSSERSCFTLNWFPSHLVAPQDVDVDTVLNETVAWWLNWSKGCTYQGRHRDIVMRSLITLKALTYEPTGAIVAAATTSLPESLGGVRNWDYRYCWLRDSTFTVLALLNSGYKTEAQNYVLWLMRAIAGEPGNLQIMYGVAGEQHIDEYELAHLQGYENSRPVRIGNAASSQIQLDVFGEIVDALYQAMVSGVDVHVSYSDLIIGIVEYVRSLGFPFPDKGMWEVRGPARYFVESQVMLWVMLDRSIRLAEQGLLQVDPSQWRAERDQLKEQILLCGFNTKLGSFVQSYDSEEIDASLLMIPLVGFLPVDDPRVVSTIQYIEKTLLKYPFVSRYATESAGDADGLPAGDGAFFACSFWLCDVYCLQGRQQEAEKLFETLIGFTNDLGLLSEEYDVQDSRLIGNFPQAFSHFALVNTAQNLNHPNGPAQQRSSV